MQEHNKNNLKFNLSPIETIKEDFLNRGQFVNVIANHITNRSKKSEAKCETIGIYGKWGEGKTSILNLIKERIKETNQISKIELIDFNPWLFNDQESFLLDFFSVLQKHNKKLANSKAFKKYTSLISIGVGGIIEASVPRFGSILKKGVEKTVDLFFKDDVSSLKKKINNVFKKGKVHYVVFIDDVDRLDKGEMHALFKLIKQTADFFNTTYIIAMDVDMVAKSIGDRFEAGCEAAGRNFIEKIVQYPLYLPKIEDGYIYKTLLNELTKICNIITNKNDNYNIQNTLPPIIANISPLFRTVRRVWLFLNPNPKFLGNRYLHLLE